MDSLWTFLPIVILLLLAAFFGGAETALTAASQPRMLELERQGDPRAALVNGLRSNRERMIGSLLTAQNIVAPLASVLTTSLFLSWFGAGGEVYATVALSVLFIVFGEVLPKTYALYAPDRTSLAIAPIVAAVVRVLAPLTAAVEWIVRRVLTLFGIRTQQSMLATTEEELRGVISMHVGPEPEIEAERRMLSSILDLGDVKVGEVMTHRSATAMIDAEKSTPVILRQVLASPYSRLPVYRGNPDNIIGVLDAKDLLRAISKGKGAAAQLDLAKLVTPAWYIPESTSLLDQLREFRRRREHFALVVDEYGAFQGVVTLEDILEEIVGKIGDAPEQAQSGMRAVGDGSYIVGGEVTVRDVNRELGWDLPDDRAATVAGLVMHEARRIPEVRQTFAFHGFRFEILRKKNNRITALKVKPMNGAAKKPAPEAGAGPPAPAPAQSQNPAGGDPPASDDKAA
ncbi:MAG TPA: CNNM domain-containing protein [Alphaproteobacteria bacterium]|jgi:Mg2+/Co2+ transporter CorB